MPVPHLPTIQKGFPVSEYQDFATSLAAKLEASPELAPEPAPEETPSTEEPEPQQAPPEAAAEATPSEEAPKERPRDEKGRFVTETAEEKEARLLAGKYRTVEDLERAYTEAQTLIGQQGSELAGWRQTAQQGTQQDQPLPLNEQTVGAFDQLVEQNPHAAASWALQANQPLLYERAMESWYDFSPKDASRFEMVNALARQQAEFQQQAQTQMEPLQERHQQEQYALAIQNLRQRHPDVLERLEGMMGLAQERPHLLYGLASHEQADREKTLEDLYLLHSALNPSQAQAQVEPEEARHPHVVSASNSLSSTPQTPQEAFKSAFREYAVKRQTSARSGITRPSE